MDAEKRHHLKQNELAEALTKLRGWSTNRDLQLWVVGILVVLIIFVGYRQWKPWYQGRQARAWRELSEVSQKVESNTPNALDELRAIATGSSNPTLSAAARLRLAAALRAKATETGTVDTAALKDSVQLLEPLLNERGLSPGLTGAAGLSLATSYEALRQFDDAERVYKLLLDEQRFAGTGYPKAAAERLKTLPDLRKPVEFAAGLPPQETPPTPTAPEMMGPAPTISITPTQIPGAAAQPTGPKPTPAEAAPVEPANQAGGSEPQTPAAQPGGNQGP